MQVEDIVDTGLTISTVSQQIKEWGAASVVCVTLLDKKERRKLPYVPEYVGFQVSRAKDNTPLVSHGSPSLCTSLSARECPGMHGSTVPACRTTHHINCRRSCAYTTI